MEKIIIEKDNCNDVEQFVKFNLHKYNQKNCDYIRNNSSYAHNNTINGDFIIYDNNEIIGGALGYIRFGWYQLTDFYIDERYRGKGLWRIPLSWPAKCDLPRWRRDLCWFERQYNRWLGGGSNCCLDGKRPIHCPTGSRL